MGAVLKQNGSAQTVEVPIQWYNESVSTTRAEGVGAKKLQDFIDSVAKNHGYYIARYEASFGIGEAPKNKYKYETITSIMDNQKPEVKVSINANEDSMNYTEGTLWNWITQEDAAKVSKNMYKKEDNDVEANYVESDLVNSYAWDTAIDYIQAMGNNYAFAASKFDTLKNTGETRDEKCHICDMAGNLNEWTTEYSTYVNTPYTFPCALRGGNYLNSFDYTSLRNYGSTSDDAMQHGFRPILYLKK